jgi:hypothetical protein
MEKQLGLYSKNEVEFNMEGLDKSNIEDVTITMPGYIILPNGDFVTVCNKRHHRDVFDEYLTNYLDSNYEQSDTMNAIKILNENKHIVFCGVRTGYVNNGYVNSNQGRGYIFTTDINEITNEQVNSIKLLLETNLSAISRRNILEIIFANTKTNEELNEFDFFQIIDSLNKNK